MQLRDAYIQTDKFGLDLMNILIHVLEKQVEDMEQPQSQFDLILADGFFF